MINKVSPRITLMLLVIKNCGSLLLMLIVGFNFSHEKKTMYTLDTMINKVTSMIPRMLLVIKKTETDGQRKKYYLLIA